MNNSVKSMLTNLYKIFNEKFPNKIQAWDKYLEFIVADQSPYIYNQLNHKFEWLIGDSKLVDKIFDIYTPHLLKQDKYDYLGEIYRDNCIPEERRENFLIPYEVAQADSVIAIGSTDKNLNVFDPTTGTGRHILTGHNLAPNAVFFGIESNLRLSRIALTNIMIHDIKGYILHAYRNFHETDIQKKMGLENWKFSNKWYDQTDNLKPRLVDMPSQKKSR